MINYYVIISIVVPLTDPSPSVSYFDYAIVATAAENSGTSNPRLCLLLHKRRFVKPPFNKSRNVIF